MLVGYARVSTDDQILARIENQIHGADKERLERVVTVCEAVGKVSNQDVKGKMEEKTASQSYVIKKHPLSGH